MERTLGALRDIQDSRDYKFKDVFKAPSTIPNILDYEDEMTTIKNQGDRGSCVAFACCAIREHQEGTQWFKEFDLSEEMLYRQIMIPGGGSFPREAVKVLNKIGTCREGLWEYDRSEKDSNQKYIINWREHRRALGNARRFTIGEYAVLSGFDEVMQSLVINGPCLMGANWQRDWSNRSRDSDERHGGYPILDIPSNMKAAGGHAFVIVGYNKKEGLFKIRNSWGERWGKGGYAYMTFRAYSKFNWNTWAIYDRTSPYRK
jgi:hypothetical protein